MIAQGMGQLQKNKTAVNFPAVDKLKLNEMCTLRHFDNEKEAKNRIKINH